LLAFIALIKLNFTWLLIVAVAMSLSIANVIGYTKCEKDAKKKVSGFVSRNLVGGILGSGMTGLTGGFERMMGSGGNSTPAATGRV
jgi:hypothetical protein